MNKRVKLKKLKVEMDRLQRLVASLYDSLEEHEVGKIPKEDMVVFKQLMEDFNRKQRQYVKLKSKRG